MHARGFWGSFLPPQKKVSRTDCKMDKALFKFIFSSIPHCWICFCRSLILPASNFVDWNCERREIRRCAWLFLWLHMRHYSFDTLPLPPKWLMILMFFSEKKYFFSWKIGKGHLAHANSLTYRAITPPVPPPEPPAMDNKYFTTKGRTQRLRGVQTIQMSPSRHQWSNRWNWIIHERKQQQIL